jgi:hypothetical protein
MKLCSALYVAHVLSVTPAVDGNKCHSPEKPAAGASEEPPIAFGKRLAVPAGRPTALLLLLLLAAWFSRPVSVGPAEL